MFRPVLVTLVVISKMFCLTFLHFYKNYLQFCIVTSQVKTQVLSSNVL